LLSILLVHVVFVGQLWGEWSQYLGPNRNASAASEVKLAKSWGEQGPKQLWSVKLGPGYGGASVHESEVFVLDRVVDKADILRCLDLDSGEEKWSFSYEATGKHDHPGSRSVPAVDSEYVWIVGSFGHFHCVSRETHKPIWKTNIVTEFEAKIPRWGVAQSPVLHKDMVIVAPQGEKAGVVAFDKKTGTVLWASRKLTGHSCHVSPVVGTLDGVDQVIMISPYDKENESIKNEVVAFDAATGKELWTYDGLKSFATIAPATIIDERRVFIADCSYDGKYQPVSVMLEIKRQGDDFEVTELFKTAKAGSKMHPAVLHDGYLYFNGTGNPNGMRCLSLDGEVMWSESPSFKLGAMILADGLILNQDGGSGGLHLIEPNPEGYKELAKVELFSTEKNEPWAPLAISDGKLLIRDSAKMICLDLR